MSDKLITITLLKILDQCGGMPLAESSLFAHINIALDRVTSTAELTTELRFAQGKGWVDYKVDEFNTTKWWITERGQVELSKHT